MAKMTDDDFANLLDDFGDDEEINRNLKGA